MMVTGTGRTRNRISDALVVVGLIFWLLGVLGMVLGGPPEVRYPPQALAADLWVLSFVVRP